MFICFHALNFSLFVFCFVEWLCGSMLLFVVVLFGSAEENEVTFVPFVLSFTLFCCRVSVLRYVVILCFD